MRPNFQGQLSPLPPKAYAAPAIPQDKPCYRILKPCYLDDTMYFQGDIVTWTEEPNNEMEPLNELAHKASDAFYDKCEELGQKASAAKGRMYVPVRRHTPEDREMNTAEARRVEIVKGDGGIPVMGAKRKPGRPAKAEKLDVQPLESRPVTDASKGKH